MKIVKKLLFLSVTAVICASTAYAMAATRSPDTGSPLVGLGEKCLDVTHSGTRNGTPVQLWDCNKTPAQQWSVGSDGTVRALGRCLDVRFSGRANGSPVQLWRCNGTPAQQWRPTDQGGLLNPRSGRCLNLVGGSGARGTRVQLRDCDGSAGQRWTTAGTRPPTAAPPTGPSRPPSARPSSAAPTTAPPKPTTPAPKPTTPKPTVPPRTGSVTITSDASRAPDLAGWLADTVNILREWYPKAAAMLPTEGRTAPAAFSVTIDPSYTGVAFTSGTRIVASADYIRKHRNDTGFMVHEAVHVLQQNKNGPGWFVEGSADYIRYFFYEPGKISAPSRNSHYTKGYGTAAFFLNYVATRYDKDIVATVMDASRRGVYKESIWTQRTGKTLDALWAETPKR